jgi:hypothetical protein
MSSGSNSQLLSAVISGFRLKSAQRKAQFPATIPQKHRGILAAPGQAHVTLSPSNNNSIKRPTPAV